MPYRGTTIGLYALGTVQYDFIKYGKFGYHLGLSVCIGRPIRARMNYRN